MKLTRRCLGLLNRGLATVNLRLETLTAAKHEASRLAEVDARNGFERPAYPVPAAFLASNWRELITELPRYRERFDTFVRAADNDVGYTFTNEYFRSPDAEVLYAIVRRYQPRNILEVGCGNSTKVIRQAIRDGQLATRHRCIDPMPRVEIAALADEIVRQPVEHLDAAELAGWLAAGDVLFVDTSHEVKPANDVAHIFGSLFPRLAAGVIVHIHDIFLPYEHPRSWVIEKRLNWGEQYLVQAMLANGDGWDVLWPGHYLQRSQSDFAAHFPHLAGTQAQSLWLRKRITAVSGNGSK